MNTAPAPNAPAPPGMCPGLVVEAGGADSAGAGGSGGKGKGGKGKGKKGQGPDGSSGAKNGGPNPGKYQKCGTKGHPVDVVTGRAFTHPMRDFSLGGPLPLEFERTASSVAASRDFGIGWGWSHTLGWLIEVRRDMLRVWTELGTTVDFPLLNVGQEHLGPFGWVLRREPWGYALDADDEVWRLFSVSTEGKQGGSGMSPVLEWCHGEAWLLTAIEDRNQNRIELRYDVDTLRLSEVKDCVGRLLRVRWGQSGRISRISVSDNIAVGNWLELVRFDHDSEGHLVAATDPDGFTAHYGYDAPSHRLVLDRDRTGLTFHFVYWPDGRCRETWGSYAGRRDPSVVAPPRFLHDGATPWKGIHHCLFEYGDDFFSSVTDSTQTTTFQGNEFGLVEEENEGPTTSQATYRGDGNLLSVTDGVGATTRYERDPRGRIVGATDPLGAVTIIERDPHGLPIRIVHPTGSETVMSRDYRGNLQWVREASGALTRYERLPNGLVSTMIGPNGGRTISEYDGHGNLVLARDPDGNTWRFTYDAVGRRTSVTDPLGHVSQYQFSSRGDLIGVRDPLGNRTVYTYDGERHLISAVSPAGHTIQFEWGGYHKLVRRVDANGHKLRLGYNVEGELTHLWNERGELHTLEYTPCGDLREEHTFDGRTIRYRYDAIAQPVQIVNGAKEVTEIEYDLAGQVVKRKLHDDSEEEFEYDLLGNLVRATSPGIEVSLERDAVGNVIRETQTLGGVTHSVELAYDLNGDRVERRTSLGLVERVTRDLSGNRQLSIIDGREVAHTWDPFGNETSRQLPGGGAIESSYDPLGRLYDRRALGRPRGSGLPQAQPQWVGERPGNVTAYKGFRYNADGELIEAIDRDSGRIQLKYDPVGQLLARLPERARAELFSYDKTGNVSESGPGMARREHGRGNRLVRKDNAEYTWDADGRLIARRVLTAAAEGAAAEVIWQYGWNAAGLLEKVERNDGLHVAFVYDHFARRLEKRVSRRDNPLAPPRLERRTRFVWDGDVLVHEIREDASSEGDPVIEERTYWFEDDGFAPVAHREKRLDDVGRTVGGWFHYLNDSSGTPEKLVGEDGSIAADFTRTAWGPLVPRGSSTASTPLQRQGQYWDDETGLAYNRWRYYDGEGRFISADPLLLAAGPNGFALDPGGVDPFGLDPTTNMSMGERLEAKRRKELTDDGWTIHPSKYGGGKGPDIVATRVDASGGTETLIEECKAGKKNGLKMTKHHGKQMSDKWIKNAIKELRKRKCTKAAGDALAQAMKDKTLQKQLTKGHQKKKGCSWNAKTTTLT